MSIRIELQNQMGEWRYFTSVTFTGNNVKRALQSALRSPQSQKFKKARAVDKFGNIVDIETL